MDISKLEAKIKSTQVAAAYYLVPSIIFLFLSAAIVEYYDLRELDDFRVITIIAVVFLVFLSMAFGGIILAFKKHMPRCNNCNQILNTFNLDAAKKLKRCVHCGEYIVPQNS